MTSATPIATGGPAAPSTPAASAASTAAGSSREAAAGGFPSLLSEAVAQGLPKVVAEALDALAAPATGEAAGETAGEEVSEDTLAEAVAAVAGAVQTLRVPLVAAVRATDTAGDIPQWDSEVAPLGEASTTAASVSAGERTAELAAPAASAVAPKTATMGAMTAVAPAVGDVDAAPAPAGVAALSPATARASDPVATPDVSAGPGGDAMPVQGGATSSSTATVTATAAPSGTAPAEDTGLHARIVARVVQAVEALENAPPPRRMTVEVPDSDGLRLQVAMRGTEVHVSIQSGTGQPDLGAWGRELAASLASRGMSLGGFRAGADAQPGQQQPQPQSDQPDAPPARPGDAQPGSRPDADGALRL